MDPKGFGNSFKSVISEDFVGLSGQDFQYHFPVPI